MAIRKTLLPSEYQQVEYIYKTEAAPWIDTGRKANLNTKVEVKFKYNVLPYSTSIIVGARGTSSTTNAFVLGITSGHEYYARFGNGLPNEERQTYDTDMHIMTNSIDGGYLDDIKIATYATSQSDYETPYSVALFASRENDGTTTFNALYCRIYYYKVWENDVLVQELIPCYRKSDNEIGFYDLVGKTFLTNANSSGSFAVGSDINPKVATIKKAILPSTYQQVEYIESTGTQYIDSGVKPELSDHLYIKAKPNGSSNTGMIFGAYYNSGFGIQVYQSNLRIWGFKGWKETTTSANDLFELKTTDDKTYINGTEIDNYVKANANDNYYIFGGNYDGEAYILSNGARFYCCKIERSNGTLVRNFIPCYRKSDNEIGLYDLVNDVFYTNQGTGTFNKGNDITPNVKLVFKGGNFVYTKLPSAYQQVEYIESTGTQYIDSGVHFAENQLLKFKINWTSYASPLFGANGASNEILLGHNNLYTNYLGGEFSYSWSLNTTYDITLDLKKTSNNLKLNINGSEIRNVAGNILTPIIYLFASAITNGSVASNKAPAKMYYFKIYNGDILVRYFIPCYRKSDNELGMFDIINNKFFTNAGSGTFRGGSDI